MFYWYTDWVWDVHKSDDEIIVFLSWVCDPQTISAETNILTEEELAKWEKLNREEPDKILSGQRLQDALQVVK